MLLSVIAVKLKMFIDEVSSIGMRSVTMRFMKCQIIVSGETYGHRKWPINLFFLIQLRMLAYNELFITLCRTVTFKYTS
jgi:hypothetical protein